jgi:hypothetical protein
MKCNVTSYLEQQERDCRWIAQAANDGTKDQQEWLKTAEALLKRRREHIAGCIGCTDTQIPKK